MSIGFVGDTRILTLDHSTHSLEEFYNSKREDFGVYCCDEYGDIKISKASKISLVGYVDELSEINIDGKVIRCSSSQKFLILDNKWIKAKDLIIGNSLIPIFRELGSCDWRKTQVKDVESYELIHSTWDYGKHNLFTHRLVKEYLDPNNEFKIIHHNKYNKELHHYISFDNEFENIILCKTNSDHFSIHWNNEDWVDWVCSQIPDDTKFNSDKISEQNYKNWNNPSYCEYMKNVFNESILPKFIASDIARNTGDRSITKMRSVSKFLNGLIEARILVDINQLNEEFYTNERNKFKYSVLRTPSWKSALYYWKDDINKMYEDAKCYDNHDILGINTINNSQIPIYNIDNVDKYNNFAISTADQSGVFVQSYLN